MKYVDHMERAIKRMEGEESKGFISLIELNDEINWSYPWEDYDNWFNQADLLIPLGDYIGFFESEYWS